mmetsp:Transcript_38871/g.90893  ORF Transcript_38871/g.90893 Transcript_38871/m.90893 type:complete len:203 (+) Transcript_38871:970-1578(+)
MCERRWIMTSSNPGAPQRCSSLNEGGDMLSRRSWLKSAFRFEAVPRREKVDSSKSDGSAIEGPGAAATAESAVSSSMLSIPTPDTCAVELDGRLEQLDEPLSMTSASSSSASPPRSDEKRSLSAAVSMVDRSSGASGVDGPDGPASAALALVSATGEAAASALTSAMPASAAAAATVEAVGLGAVAAVATVAADKAARWGTS